MECLALFTFCPACLIPIWIEGFSVVDYNLSQQFAKEQDLNALRELGIDLKLDFILNHASVLSPQFQDILEKGENSPYKDFFINWNTFWQGHGTMTEEGYIQPEKEYLDKMFFRKPGLPILMVSYARWKKCALLEHLLPKSFLSATHCTAVDENCKGSIHHSRKAV